MRKSLLLVFCFILLSSIFIQAENHINPKPLTRVAISERLNKLYLTSITTQKPLEVFSSLPFGYMMALPSYTNNRAIYGVKITLLPLTKNARDILTKCRFAMYDNYHSLGPNKSTKEQNSKIVMWNRQVARFLYGDRILLNGQGTFIIVLANNYIGPEGRPIQTRKVRVYSNMIVSENPGYIQISSQKWLFDFPFVLRVYPSSQNVFLKSRDVKVLIQAMSNIKPQVTYGAVKIESYPKGATVKIDSTVRGVTPLIIGKLKPGIHMVEISNQGYESQVFKVLVKSGVTTVKTVQLIPARTYLTIATIPPNAKIYVDNSYVGNSPISNLPVSPGIHSIRIVKENWFNWKNTIQIASGEKKKITIKMEVAIE